MINLVNTLVVSYLLGGSFITVIGLLMNPVEGSNYYFGLFFLALFWPAVLVKVFSSS